MWIDKIIDILYGSYNDNDIIKSLVPRGSDKRQATGVSDISDRLYVAGQQWVEDENGDMVRQATSQEASKRLTAIEINAFLEEGIDLRKAALVKSLKAKGKSQQETILILTKEHGRGYKKSSISPIWSILDRYAGGEAGPSPTAPRGGTSAHVQLEVNNTDNQ